MDLKQVTADVVASLARFDLKSLAVGVMLGGVVVGYSMQSKYEGCHKVHASNIGGFVFMDGKIFNLTELHDDTYTNPPVKAKR